MRAIIKRLIFTFFKPWFDWYFSKPRKYSYDQIDVVIYPDVFPPRFTFSTKILLNFIKPLDLKNKTFLELGCGSGIISLFAASKGAKVTASDINPIAINALKEASEKNNLAVTTILSDLFKDIPKQHFDYIIINPPYYPKAPKNHKEEAWFCGENFEYFKVLFKTIDAFISSNEVLMILSEDCNIKHIKTLASSNGLNVNLKLKKRVYFEKNYIFSISK